MKKNRKIMKYAILILSLGIFIFGVVTFFEGLITNKSSTKAQVSLGCPPDTASSEWIGVGDFCIMKDELSSGNRSWDSSSKACNNASFGARLCTAAEWVAACELNESGEMLDGQIDNMLDDENEWVADLTKSDKAVLVGGGASCSSDWETEDAWGSHSSERRCCINKQY